MATRVAKRAYGSIPQWLGAAAGKWRHKDLYRNASIERGTWTYEEFHKLVRDHAVGLLGARFRPGDTIVLALDSSEPTESVVASLGSAFADLRIVYLDAKSLTSATLAATLSSTQARGLVVSRALVPVCFETIPQLEVWPEGHGYRFAAYPNFKMAIHTGHYPLSGVYTFRSLFVADPMPDPLVAIGKKQSAQTHFTAQSRFSHADVIEAGTRFGATLGLHMQDRVLVDVPQCTTHGIATGIMACASSASLMVTTGLAVGGSSSLVSAIENEAVTAIVGVPSTFAALTKAQVNDAATRRVKKIAIVVEPESAIKQTAALQQALAAQFGNLESMHVFYADERLAPGPAFGSANILKGGAFTDGVGAPLISAKPGVDWSAIGSLASDGQFSLRV